MLQRGATTLWLVTLFFLLGCSHDGPPTVQDSMSSAAAAEMQADLNQLHEMVGQAWAYLGSSRSTEELQEVHDRLSARITDITTSTEFVAILEEYAAALRDGHARVGTNVLNPPPTHTWPLGFAVVDDAVVIGNVNWLKDNPGLGLGDKLLSVNQVPIDELIEQQMRLTCASAGLTRELLAMDQLHRTNETTVQFVIEKADGTLIEQEFPCLPGEVDYRFRKRTQFCSAEELTDNISLIRIPSFTWNELQFVAARTDRDRDNILADAKAHVDAAFSSLGPTEKLILDLRGNSGGYELLSSYVAEHLIDGDFHFYTSTRRDSPLVRSLEVFRTLPANQFGQPLPQYPRRWQKVRHYEGPPYTGKLVVLIDPRCFSTTDNLCAFLKDSRPDTRFVGEPTGAGTGEPMTVGHLKHSGVSVQFCISQIHSPLGRLIEGSGTVPDRIVNRTRQDVTMRRDPYLEAAIHELQNW